LGIEFDEKMKNVVGKKKKVGRGREERRN